MFIPCIMVTQNLRLSTVENILTNIPQQIKQVKDVFG